MKKIVIALILSLVFKNVLAQTANIGSDTLQWLKTNIEQRSSFFSGKSLKILLDSLYQLKTKIVKSDPPINLDLFSEEIHTEKFSNPNHFSVDSLLLFLGNIPDTVKANQVKSLWCARNKKKRRYYNNKNHVKFIKVIFKETVDYVKKVSTEANIKPEYFWRPNIIQKVSVGEY